MRQVCLGNAYILVCLASREGAALNPLVHLICLQKRRGTCVPLVEALAATPQNVLLQWGLAYLRYVALDSLKEGNEVLVDLLLLRTPCAHGLVLACRHWWQDNSRLRYL